MKKVFLGFLIILLLGVIGIWCYFKFRFVLEITLEEKRNIEFGQEYNVKDFILETNGIFEDKIVEFYELGEKEVTLTYLDKYNKKKEYSFTVNIVDEQVPMIYAGNTVTIYKGDTNPNLFSNVICVDYVSKVKCEVEGEYNSNVIGSYPLKYVATDESGNSISKDFTLKVINRPTSTGSSTSSKVTYTPFKTIYDKYKTDKTLVGIDVSAWQNPIDFKKVKEAGADFVIMRIALFYKGNIELDMRYKENIKNAHDAGLKVGLYLYSEAKTEEEVLKAVDLILDNLDYDIDLPIAYDWEDFRNYNSYNLSLYEFNKLAYTFMDKLKEKGHDVMLYGSTNYLEKMWIPKDYDVWVAQYYKEVTYNGKYKMWQLTSSGSIPGIGGAVDVDILYLD